MTCAVRLVRLCTTIDDVLHKDESWFHVGCRWIQLFHAKYLARLISLTVWVTVIVKTIFQLHWYLFWWETRIVLSS